MKAKLVQQCERLASLTRLLPNDGDSGASGTNENRTYVLGQIAVLADQITEMAADEATRLMELRANTLDPLMQRDQDDEP